MANRFLDRIMHGPAEEVAAPLGGTRSQAIHRLQVGLSGIFAIILLVGLADTLRDRADIADAESVPEAAATVEPETVDAPQTDPLADAGVVPDLPTDPAEAAAQDEPVMPEQGGGQVAPAPNDGGAQ